MANRGRTQPHIADIVALARALDREELQPRNEASAGEREIARSLSTGRDDRVTAALAWLEVVEEQEDALRSLHQHAETATHLTTFLLGVLGVFLGGGATLAAFYFDGSGRVNVVSVLALLVALPALLILPFAVAALPPAVVRRLPGVPVLAALARALSPGRLAPVLWRVFPADLRQAVTLVAGRMTRHQRLYSHLQKWALMRWSQVLAVGFQIAALGVCVILVVFTDLAFGWSTTLTTGNADLDAERVHRITSAIATPWRWAFPEAVPSLELIEQSRYYRVASGPVSQAEAARLGNWWPFVALTIAVYGLLPRMITLGIAHARLRAATRGVVLAEPGLSAVLRRIHRVGIETRAVEPETPAANAPVDGAAGSSARAAGNVRAVINWADVPLSPGLLAETFPGAPVFSAGGAATVQEDAALVKTLGGAPEGDVVVLVKGWEPPLMEFIDFVNTLRDARRAGDTGMVHVLPVGLDEGTGIVPPPPAQFRVWRDKLAAMGDPWVRAASSVQEVQP